MSAKPRLRLSSESRTTFTVQARNQPDILLPLVSLFHDLDVGIEAIYMIRRKDAANVRINVTAQLDWERAVKIKGRLTNVPGVLSVRTELGAKDVLAAALGDELAPRSQS